METEVPGAGEAAAQPAAESTVAVVAAAPVLLNAAEIGPITAAERVELIDIVRGLALFGILAANMRGFAGPAPAYFDPSIFWPSMADRVAQAFIDTFVQGKFVTIFSFLFGVGFAVQLERGEAKGAKVGRVWARRLGILALFGFVHGTLIWFGDILLAYALIGFLLLLFRRRRDTTLISWAIVGQLVPLVLLGLAWFYGQVSSEPLRGPRMTEEAELARQAELFAHGSWSAIQEQRVLDAVKLNWGMFPFYFLSLLSLFLLGALAWRRGFFRPTAETMPLYRRWMWIGLVTGTIGNAAATAIRLVWHVPPFPPTGATLALQAIQIVAVPLLSLGYVCAVIVLCRDDAWRRRFAPFGAVGRMALSNYLMQSVICTLLFYSYGLGLFGTGGPALLLVPTLLVYAIQPAVSGWWLRRYRFGPAEWLWRSLTYRQMQPMRVGETGARGGSRTGQHAM